METISNRTGNVPVHRTTHASLADRARPLARALDRPGVRFVGDLPRTATGKLLRTRLRELHGKDPAA